MDFDVKEHNTTPWSLKILCSVLSVYPNGISETALLNEMNRRSSRGVSLPRNFMQTVIPYKGSLIDYKTTDSASGTRLFFPVRYNFDLPQAYPSVAEVMLKPGSRLPCKLVAIFSCSTFSVQVECDEGVQIFRVNFSAMCDSALQRMMRVDAVLLNVGDCCLHRNQDTWLWDRVRIVKYSFGGKDALCYLVDCGQFAKLPVSELTVLPEVCVYHHHVLPTSKQFGEHSRTIRCFLDPTKKTFQERHFPSSRTGLRLALCGGRDVEMSQVCVQLQYFGYDRVNDSFMVRVCDSNGVGQLESAIRADPDLLRKDAFFSSQLDLDHDVDSHLFETDATREDKFHKLLDLYATERSPPSGDINHRP